MDVLGLLWYVFFFFPFLFSFLFFGEVGELGWERKGGGVRSERGMDRWREGRRRKREGGWVEERVLWIGSDWTGLGNELYCSLSGCLAEREGEEERGLSIFSLLFFSFLFLLI